MLARLGDAAFDDPGWAFELKWDGYRALALITGDGTRLASRTGRDLTPAYPALANLRRAVIAQEAILDGEIVVLDEEGRPDFGALQRGEGTPVYVAFDLLYADGAWTLDLPWSERRALLEGVVSPQPGPSLMRSDHVDERGTALFAAAEERGLEGIVAKRRSAPYRPGVRSEDWLKIKIRQEAVFEIGGYTLGSGSRRHSLGAVVVGERTDEGLVHRGQVGSGFGDASARALRERLDALRVDESPFAGDAPAALAQALRGDGVTIVEVSIGDSAGQIKLRAGAAAREAVRSLVPAGVIARLRRWLR
jgi:bifunctional non-homologous end joining protein LigD